MSKLERLESTIQRTLSEILFKDIRNPHLNFITITEVRLTNDFSFLKIYFTVLGGENKRIKVEEELKKSKVYIRRQLALKVKMRKSPNLIFKYDESLDYGNRIDKGLKALHNNKKEGS